MVKLLIVGLDGLDPDLVNKWNMNWFKQKSHGRHYVGFFKHIYTPIVWGAFVTGRNVEKEGYNLGFIEEERARKLYGFLYPLYKLRKKLIKRKLGIRKLLLRLGFFGDSVYTPNMPGDMKKYSFVEELMRRGYKVSVVEVPGYNETRNEYYRSQLAILFKKPFSERKWLAEEAMDDSRKRFHEADKYVLQDYDLVFVYSPLPDIAFHLAPFPKTREILWLRRIHFDLYYSTGLKELVEDGVKRDYVVLLVSDHGFDTKNYDHSKYGFWSLSIPKPRFWRIKTILDFRDSIIRLVEEEKV